MQIKEQLENMREILGDNFVVKVICSNGEFKISEAAEVYIE